LQCSGIKQVVGTFHKFYFYLDPEGFENLQGPGNGIHRST